MKREDIEKAAGYYSGSSLGFDTISVIANQNAFVKGAMWRINSVWHDVDNELPEYNRHVVNEDWFDFTAKDEKDLKRIMNQYPFKRWAYVDDLKPNMEE
mgnify:CR=1 FL=1